MQSKKLIFTYGTRHQHQWKHLLVALFLVAGGLLSLARAVNAAAPTPGTVVAWGYNGNGETNVPAGLTNITVIDGGDAHNLALKGDGTVVAWGSNQYGQTTVPAGLTNVTAIAAGNSHNLALRGDGTVVAWGYNANGQTTVPAGLTNVAAIAAGAWHSLALKGDGTVVAWGSNQYGQTTVPAGLTNVTAIAAGDAHSLVLKGNGTVVAWGSNGKGQMTVPTGLTNVTAIAAGGNHNLALKGDGTVVAWGSNQYGQTTVPAGLTNVTAIAAGSAHSLARKGDGTVVAWGYSGDGATTVPAGLTNVAAIAAGDWHSLALVATAAPPALKVQSNDISLVNGNQINVPVVFTSNGAEIASMGFALDYQESCLAFDATDSDGNGVPNAITGLPAAFAASISHQPSKSSGELEIALYDDSSPITTLSNGTLFTVQLTVKPACLPTAGASTTVAINFAASPAASFGDPTGADVTGTTTGATITLQPANTAPTTLSLDNSSVAENSAVNTTVGAFSTTDVDSGDSHTYSLVSGAGDSDNASFTINGNTLKTAALFDYETKNSYTIRVRTTDSGGLFFEQSFTITVTDVNDIPVAVDDLVDPRTKVFLGGETEVINVLVNDLANGGLLSVASVTQPATGGGSVTNNTTNVNYTAPNSSGSAIFTYQATNGSATSNSANVTVNYVANHTRGDCNGNGGVSAADFIGVVLEIFDANNLKYENQPAWWLTHTGDYAGSPLGCDANNSRNGANNSSASITAADITCAVLIFFGHACGTGVQATSADRAAALSVAASANGGQTTIPVMLKTGGHAVAATAFALALGDSTFDATDADGDGLPDAVTLNVPAGVTKSVVWNAAAKRLDVALYGVNLPLPTLRDGVLATVTVNGVATPMLTQVSLSDREGNDLLAPTRAGVFLPLITR